jgi:FkbM family methyltransferase
MLPSHRNNAPNSYYVGKETVPIIRLDSIDYIPDTSKVFLKIDTQGYEREVLEGATRLLPLVHGMQIELSIAPLYRGSLHLHP